MPESEADVLRGLIREAHAATKDLRVAQREAKADIDRYVRDFFDREMRPVLKKEFEDWAAVLNKVLDGKLGEAQVVFDRFVNLLIEGRDSSLKPDPARAAIKLLEETGVRTSTTTGHPIDGGSINMSYTEEASERLFKGMKKKGTPMVPRED